MGQIISGDNSQSKALESAGLFKMTGASGDRIRATSVQSGKDEEDVNNLVPFLQFLNQQIFQTNKSFNTESAKIDGNNITVEQAMSLLQGNVTFPELQQALINLAVSRETAGIDRKQNGQTGISVDDLLNEMNLLKNKAVTGDVDPLLTAAPEQSDSQEKVLSGNNAGDAIIPPIDKEPQAKSGNNENEQIIMNDQKVILNQPGGITLETVRNNLLSEDESSEEDQIKIADMKLKNTAGKMFEEVKADNINLQSQSGKEAADNEIKFKIPSKEKEFALNTDERTFQSGKTISREAQLSAGTVGKITANFTDLKEENKTGRDILPADSGKEDSAAGKNSRLTTQEMKESLISKDNIRRYSNSANAKVESKAQADTMQAIMGEVTGKIKAEQKGKIISGEKGDEEISLTGVNAAGSGSAAKERINDVTPDKIISQISGEIKEAAANDGGRVKMTLNPPSLGKLEMDVTVRNGKVEVVLVADNKDVQQTLNTHIDKLKGCLQNQGLTIDRCDVFMQDKRDEYQQSFSQHAFYHQGGSGQGDNRRRENPEEKVKSDSVISERSGSVLRVSMDNISLFA